MNEPGPVTPVPSSTAPRGGPLGYVERLSDKSVVAIVFVTALFMDIMDGTIVNTSLPQIGKELGATTSQLSWVVLGYLLSSAIWIPASGWIGDRFGTKRTFLFALAVFTAASMLCGTAHSVEQLSLFRFLQGVGGGMLTPVGTAMLFRTYPPAERARASAILIVPTLVAPAIGPVLGGYLTDGPGWRWIFYVNVPIGAAAFAFGWWRLREVKHDAPGRFDPWGFVLSAAALASILYALNQAPSDGWLSTTVLVFGLGGVALAAIQIWVELHVAEPMLALRLFKERLFRATNIVSVFSTASFFGLLLLLPLMLQNVRGLSAAQSGLTTFPQALGVICASQLVRKLYPIVGPRRLLFGGLLAASLVILTLQLTDATTNLWYYRVMLFVRGLCMAFAFIPSQAATFARISPPDTGRASAIFSTQRQVANSLGIGILITVLVDQLARVHVTTTAVSTAAQQSAELAARYNAFKVPFLLTAIFAMVGAVAALFIHDADAAATMRPST